MSIKRLMTYTTIEHGLDEGHANYVWGQYRMTPISHIIDNLQKALDEGATHFYYGGCAQDEDYNDIDIEKLCFGFLIEEPESEESYQKRLTEYNTRKEIREEKEKERELRLLAELKLKYENNPG